MLSPFKEKTTSDNFTEIYLEGAVETLTKGKLETMENNFQDFSTNFFSFRSARYKPFRFDYEQLELLNDDE